MKTLTALTWELDSELGEAELVAAMAPHGAVALGQAASTTRAYYDDADAHLWRSNHLLYESGGVFRLLEGDAVVAEAALRAGPTFWWDFPEGQCREILASLIGVRALVPLATITLRETALRLSNADGKIVVKGRITMLLAGEQARHYLTLTPLRGYGAQFKQAARTVAHAPGASACSLDVRALLFDIEQMARAAVSLIRAPITKHMATGDAVRALGRMMLEQAQAYVPGVLSDVDTEFLHQYRVNLRKLRSLVSLLQQALPAASVALLKPGLKEMAAATNRLRDLDVFLLAERDYRALLPPSFEAGVRELGKRVHLQRRQEFARVAASLDGPAFRDLAAACMAALAAPAGAHTAIGSKPVLARVKRMLRKRFARMSMMSLAIGPHSADDELHALRIEFKKLRYMLEFFFDLLPRERTKKVLSEIKQVQTVLGDFNDYGVQAAFLGAYLDRHHAAMSNALSGLIAVLHLKQAAQRDAALGALSRFFTENMRIQFSLIFAGGKAGKMQ